MTVQTGRGSRRNISGPRYGSTRGARRVPQAVSDSRYRGAGGQPTKRFRPAPSRHRARTGDDLGPSQTLRRAGPPPRRHASGLDERIRRAEELVTSYRSDDFQGRTHISTGRSRRERSSASSPRQQAEFSRPSAARTQPLRQRHPNRRAAESHRFSTTTFRCFADLPISKAARTSSHESASTDPARPALRLPRATDTRVQRVSSSLTSAQHDLRRRPARERVEPRSRRCWS